MIHCLAKSLVFLELHSQVVSFEAQILENTFFIFRLAQSDPFLNRTSHNLFKIRKSSTYKDNAVIVDICIYLLEGRLSKLAQYGFHILLHKKSYYDFTP